ncbi:hypothetical protein CHARACLAT_027352 [Characodon lateralis]|uniref:Uncharacterized protein n=1 Tax=Characodon lateralis TaxID=208331 RepID=A0ABU7DEP2_9TELE|nr:hypothetical protein [Characodon lateralis]
MRTHKNTHTHTQHKDKQQWMSYTHSHSPYILYTPRSSPGYPIGTTSPRTQEVVPFLPGEETGRLPQHLNLVRAILGSCLNLSDPVLDPAPSPVRSPPSSSGEGAMYKRGVYMVQTSLPTRATE